MGCTPAGRENSETRAARSDRPMATFEEVKRDAAFGKLSRATYDRLLIMDVKVKEDYSHPLPLRVMNYGAKDHLKAWKHKNYLMMLLFTNWCFTYIEIREWSFDKWLNHPFHIWFDLDGKINSTASWFDWASLDEYGLHCCSHFFLVFLHFVYLLLQTVYFLLHHPSWLKLLRNHLFGVALFAL